MFYKIISLITSALVFINTLFPAMLGAGKVFPGDGADTANLTGVADYINYIQENGVPSLSSEAFMKTLSPLTAVRRLLTGRLFDEEQELFLDLTLDETLSGMCDYLKENSGLDVEGLLGHLPQYSTPLDDMLAGVLNINTENFRNGIYAAADKARAEGHTFLATAMYSFAIFFGVAKTVRIYTVPSEADPDEVVVLMDIVYRDGTTETQDPDITINTVTGLARNTNTEDAGIAGFGFNVNIYDLVLYATVHSWQRSYGFSILYDLFSASVANFNYLTRRYHFDYNGKEWLVQIWKGNYALITNGAEVGTYTREPGTAGTFYSAVSDDEMMKIGMTLLHGDETLVSVAPSAHWWQNAFKLSKTLYMPQDLTLQFSIECPDEAFLTALSASIDAHPAGDVQYTTDGLVLSATW
ncbi:MAG: DUF4474 domain-containing protein [Clostridia bacterium]|nr:DUF4474 domain-containing protein [Clostridia bacterium]